MDTENGTLKHRDIEKDGIGAIHQKGFRTQTIIGVRLKNLSLLNMRVEC